MRPAAEGAHYDPSVLLFHSKRSYKDLLGLKVQLKILTQGKGPQKYTWGQRSTQALKERPAWSVNFLYRILLLCSAGHPEPESDTGGARNKVNKAAGLSRPRRPPEEAFS